MQNIPRKVKTKLRAAMHSNADELRELAQQYVPHGLETDALHDSIQTVEAGPTGMLFTVEANTPYAHFVEMDVHPSYGSANNAMARNPGTTVFGARQGAPQGPHYMRRATEDYAQQAHSNVRDAMNRAIREAIAQASASYSGHGLDFDTKQGALAFGWGKRAAGSRFAEIAASTAEGGISPLPMDLGGM